MSARRCAFRPRRRPDRRTLEARVTRAEWRVEAAEKRILARARAWFALTGKEVPARKLLDAPGAARAQVEHRQRVEKAMGRFIIACGLDEEARGDLRAAKRRCRS